MSQDHVYKVAIVGLSFGAEFIPIYQRHPNAEMVAICQRNEGNLNDVGDAFKIPAEGRYTDYAKLLENDEIEVVHINTPPFFHADQCVAALEAGKHAACTIPLALPEEIQPFTIKGVYSGEEGEQHLSFAQGSGHGGSHPHLVHEFLSALIEDREPYPNKR